MKPRTFLKNVHEELRGHCGVERTVILWFSTQSGLAIFLFLFTYLVPRKILIEEKSCPAVIKNFQTADLKHRHSPLYWNVN